MTKQESYVEKCYPLAVKAGLRFGMNPLTILAQGALESDWGTSSSVRTRKNFFGITAAGNPNEFWSGKFTTAVQSKLKFRVYESEQDSFMDFARLIAEKYKAAHAVNNDYRAYAQAIANSPYISESNGDNRESYRKGVIAAFEQLQSIASKKDCFEPQP